MGLSEGGLVKRWRNAVSSKTLISSQYRNSYRYFLFYLFRLFSFPTKKKDPHKREEWKKLINRQEEFKKGKLWSPPRDSKVCSRHFQNNQPKEEHPHPTEHLGYDASSKIRVVIQPQKRRRLYREPLNVVSCQSHVPSDNSDKDITHEDLQRLACESSPEVNVPDEEAVNVDEESQIQDELEYNKTTTGKDTNSATAEVDNIRLSNFAFLVIFINLV